MNNRNSTQNHCNGKRSTPPNHPTPCSQRRSSEDRGKGAQQMPGQCSQYERLSGTIEKANSESFTKNECSQKCSQSSQIQDQGGRRSLNYAGGPECQNAEGIVNEMDKKFEKFRKKIQKDSATRGPKKCKKLQEMFKRPPWGPPESPPPREFKNRVCRVYKQDSAEQEPGNCAPHGEGNDMSPEESSPCRGTAEVVAADNKCPKPKLKKFSSPANLRKKLQNYFENKTEDKRKPIGSLMPFYDGTIDLTSCLVRGAKEGLEPWEVGTYVCEHPDFNEDCSCPTEDLNSAKEELECFKNIMPPNLTCQQQLDYMECMGATNNAIKQFRELQMAASGNNGSECGYQSNAPTGTDSTAAPGMMDFGNLGNNDSCPCDQLQTDGKLNETDMANGNYEAYLKKLINDANETTKKLCGDGTNTTDNQAEPAEEKGKEDPRTEEELQNLRIFGPPIVAPPRSMAETFRLYKEHLSNIRRRYFGAVCKDIDDVEDITPETAAAMVLTEEQGVKLKSAPAKLYEYLYPDHPSQPLLKIGSVTEKEYLPDQIDTIVVPLVPPMMLQTADFPGLEDPAMLDSPRVIQVGPSLNLADEPEISSGTPPADIVEVVTGQCDTFTDDDKDQLMLDDEEEEEQEAYDFDIKLHQAMPPHYSRFQLRGSQAPNWFPGYYVAMPSRRGVVVQDRIGNVLEKAWEETQPESVKPGGGATIIGH